MNPSQKFARAVELHRSGRIDEAAVLYRKIVQREPKQHSALNLLGLIECQRGRVDAALHHLRRAVALAPQVAKYHYDLAVALHTGGQPSAAIEAYFNALGCDPSYEQAWENLGVALFDDGQLTEAMEVFRKALQLNPHSLLSLSNLATLLRWQGDHDQASELLDYALALDPLHAELRMKRAELLLSLGRYEQGWKEYGWRFERAGHQGGDKVRYVHLPKWSGGQLSGRRVLVHAEQGIGDEVMFASCLPQLIATGAQCTLLCDARLVGAFSRAFPELGVVAWTERPWGDVGEGVDAEFRLPMGDLPLHFRPTDASFESRAPYLQADEEKLRAWKRRLAELGRGLKVGISWRGGRNAYTRRARSIPLALWETLFGLPDVEFFNLQYGDCGDEIGAAPAVIGERLHSFAEIDPLSELEDFFALVSALDLVISIDNSTVHFAGALGVPTLALLPALADWRWPVSGEASRWYPNVRIVRQQHQELNQWAPVLARVADIVGSGVVGNGPVRRSAAGLEASAAEPSAEPVPAARRRAALLLNDTSFWYHWGCTCTSLAIREQLHARGYEVKGLPAPASGTLHPVPSSPDQLDNERLFRQFAANHPEICRQLEQAELVVINGEGTIHGAGPAALALLYLGYLARTRYDTPVQLINHSCYPNDSPQLTGSAQEAFYAAVYSTLGATAAREPLTLRILNSLGVPVRASFDCLPLFAERRREWIVREPGKRVVLAGSAAVDAERVETMVTLVAHLRDRGYQPVLLVGANAFPAADDRVFVRAMSQSSGEPVELVHCTSALQWLSAIASAGLLISGRFHHSIAAAVTQTPFIALNSNTPKIEGLMEVLGLPGRVVDGDPDYSQSLFQMAGEALSSPEAFRMSGPAIKELEQRAAVNFDF